MQIIKSIAFAILIGTASIGLTIASAQAVIFNVSGGQLTGAQDVDLGSLGLFDVTFVDGSCISVFGGCDEAADFDFTNETDATTAAQALLDQVFVDVGAGLFDTNPELTAGCSNTLICIADIAFGIPNLTLSTFDAVRSRNSAPGFVSDTVFGLTSEDRATDFSTAGTRTFARFTQQTSSGSTSVPEPATMLLFGVGLAGLAGIRRRRKTA